MRPKDNGSGSSGRRRSDIKRDKIVRSAAKLFLDKGYENVSINDIIDVVGGSKGTIYSNFGSKEKLFEAVVEQMCAGVTLRIGSSPKGTEPRRTTVGEIHLRQRHASSSTR